MTKNAKFKSNPTVLAQYRNVNLQLPVDISHIYKKSKFLPWSSRAPPPAGSCRW